MYFNVINQIRSIVSKKVSNAVQNAGKSGSTPNKIVSLATSFAAAYAVGIDPTYVAIVVMCSVLFFLPQLTVPRWLMEVLVAANLIIISTTTLPQHSVNALIAALALVKFVEGFCCLSDKFIQAYAAWTADKKHSYYFYWVMALATLNYVALKYAALKVH